MLWCGGNWERDALTACQEPCVRTLLVNKVQLLCKLLLFHQKEKKNANSSRQRPANSTLLLR